MAYFSILISALAVTFVSAQTAPMCKFTQEEVMKDVMQCVTQPALLIQVLEHLNNPASMATLDFICPNQKDIIDALMCMEKKLASCFPSAETTINQYMPSKDHMTEAFKFMCDHKKDLLEKNCMDQNQIQEFMQCYMGKLTSILKTVREDHDMQAAMCSIIHTEEGCLTAYPGSCSQTYINILFQVLKKLVPYCPALVVDINEQQKQKMSDALGSMLVRGEPLLFKPHGDAQYKVVNG